MRDEFAANTRIKTLREAIGLTRDEFSVRAGIGATQLSNIEQKKQKAYAWHLEEIAKQWPEYAYWLMTGKILPEVGQISPELEEVREKLERAG